ncbi:hypothetical protein EX895_000680 [Sporisorium graminicola]|uniref:CID domain-containing protein n=1 Tax=Sporisorium graminicola TaxID=280036 RepID=A0A4U7L5B4_9BASI|nr:hypothetical protein EX895_000680 [Sporisorium graminicola]TKY90682.1 hypothetical protein EX895_000680 [Sporisorium graminicola]
MDPFQVRLRFVSSLHRVNASLPTIQKALSFIVDYAPQMHAELWDCIIDECKKGSINRRINLLFLIDAIFTDETLSSAIRTLFRQYLERDLYALFDLAVPEGRWDALLNVPAVSKIIAAWKARFILDRSTLEDLEVMLQVRKDGLYALSPDRRNLTLLPPNDMQRRIEEDRERHKRLRERSWILPPTAFSHQSLFGTRPEQLDPTYLTRAQPASSSEQKEDIDGDRIWTTQDLDFSQMWDETSDFNDDDIDEIVEDEKLSWVHQLPPPAAAAAAIPTQPTADPSATTAQLPPAQRQPPRAPASMRFAQQQSS